ncbi:MAG: glycohydrolase toxin TNT-related protein [Planctomycetota bacterium]
MSDNRKRANSSPVKSPVECCPKPTVDLEYLDCRGKGIGGAKYQVYSVNWDGKKDGKFSKSGTLDGNGKAHIDNVPEIKALEYYFEKDPKPYEPELVPSKTPDRDETASMLDSIAIWLVDTAKGDFNQEQTIGQITVNALLGLIPVVDQVLDARDLTAGLKAIIDYYIEDEAEQQKHPDELGLDYEKWIWINVFIISIGCIPIVGSAVKGVFKGVIHYLKQAGKVAGKLSPIQLRKGWEFLVKILNHFGVGNAHKWLKVEFPAKIDGWMNTASKTIRGALDTIEKTADKAVSAVSFFSSTKAAEIDERVRLYKKAIDKAKSKIDDMTNQVKAWFKEQVQILTGGAHKSEEVGATGTRSRPIENKRLQKQAKPPDLQIPNNPRWYNPDGSPRWPPNDGFHGIPKNITLAPGTRIDRYGGESGKFVSPAGTPYEARALPHGSDQKPYKVYEVLKPIDVKAGEIEPWFGQPGMGEQFKLDKSIQDLLDQGYIREVS